jgi:hypothetical protein
MTRNIKLRIKELAFHCIYVNTGKNLWYTLKTRHYRLFKTINTVKTIAD